MSAACAGKALMWSEHEAQWARARGGESAYRALKPLYALCSICPLREPCADWAAADGYSGVAAGMLWSSGEPLGHVRVRRRLSDAS